MRDSRIRFLVFAVSVFALTACSSIPLGTLWKMRNFDPLTAEPAQIRVAVITDKLVQLHDRSTSITLAYRSEQAEHNFENISYATVKTNTRVEQLEKYQNQNQAITLFFLDEEASHTMRIAQRRLQDIKYNDIEGNGSLAVNVDTGCFNGPKPEKLEASIYVLFKPEQGYIKMVSGVDLLEATEKEQQNFWVECKPQSLKPTS